MGASHGSTHTTGPLLAAGWEHFHVALLDFGLLLFYLEGFQCLDLEQRKTSTAKPEPGQVNQCWYKLQSQVTVSL